MQTHARGSMPLAIDRFFAHFGQLPIDLSATMISDHVPGAVQGCCVDICSAVNWFFVVL